MGHTSAGSGISGMDLAECVTSLDMEVSRGCLAQMPRRLSIRITWPRPTFLEPQGAVPQALTFLEGAKFIA